MNLPKLTHQQQAIIRLLYRHRFLDRTQIQALMQHKDKRRIMSWLKDLREKEYVEWIYNKDNFAEKTKPAIYYLKLNGIRLLRTLGNYPAAELRKRYRESSRQQDFISRSLLIASCCVILEARSLRNNLDYLYATEADYANPEHKHHFLNELKPHFYFRKQENIQKHASKKTITNYLLELFDPTTPRYMVKKRLNDYVAYIGNDEWRADFDGDELVVLIACSTKAELIYAKHRTKLLLEDIELDEGVHMRFATVEQVKQEGVTGIIWEEMT